ncbi:MAG: NusG domain II-containing protein [Clostridia bacterium]|nr:NusG domain II-containing protein [Clostridia bacterium]
MNSDLKEERSSRIFRDITLVFAVAFVGLFIYLITLITAKPGGYVKVTIDNGTPIYYSLSSRGDYQLNGGTNTLVISGGKAFIKDADCPDKVCENSGKISRVGERVVCLPNRVYVEIVEERGD